MKEYQDFLLAFEELKKLVDSYYIYDDFGEQPKLRQEDVEDLNKKYMEVFRLASVYIDSVPEKDAEAEKTNMEHADLVQEKLQKDMLALMNFVPGSTLPSCLQYTNHNAINVSDKEFDHVGANSNHRSKMTITGPDGLPITGFFTEERFIGTNPALVPMYIEKAIKKNPEFKEIFEYALPKILSYEHGYLYCKDKDAKKELDEKFGNMENYKRALELLDDAFHSAVHGEMNAQGFLREKNSASRFDTRNVGMTNVAHLLGVDNLIAKSSLLTLENNGDQINGCFMEFAKGEDPDNPDTESWKMVNMNESSFDNSPVLKQLSDLQVLDYICGNTDRHNRNMFYQCDKNGKLLGIMGIDNDMSFGHMGKELGSINSAGLKSIFHMSKSMYDKVMKLDDHMLVHALDGLGLEKTNIDFTIERLHAIKEKINDGGIIIIDDKDYESFKLSDFTLKDYTDKQSFTYKDKTVDEISFFSIYRNASITIGTMTDKRENLKRLMKEHPDKPNKVRKPKRIKDSDVQLGFMETKDIKIEELEIGTDAPAVNNLGMRLERSEKYTFNSSEQFKNVKRDLEALGRFTQKFGKDVNTLGPKDVQSLSLAYEVLLKDCDDYLNYKKDQGKLNAWSWTTTGKKISAVKAVAEFCKGRINVLNKAIENSTLDREAIDKKGIREMKDEALQLMLDTKNPKDVGDYMKTLIEMQAENPNNKQILAKLGQQMSMCMEYIEEKGGDAAEYGLSKEDASKAKELLQAGRAANTELKKDQLDNIKETSKAAIMNI